MNSSPTTVSRRAFRLPLRFSLRAFLVALTVICVLLARKQHQVTTQRKAVSTIRKLGGDILYDHEDGWGLYRSPHGTRVPPREDMPEWLFNALGPDWCSDVIHVRLDAPTDRFAVIEDLPGLRRAELGSAHALDDSALDTLAGLGSLEELVISGRAISADAWSRLKPAKALRSLEVVGKDVTDDDLRSIASLHQLTHLTASTANITSAGLNALAPLHELETLTFASMGFDSNLDAGLATIGRFTGLKELILDSADIGDEGVGHLRDHSNLTTLSFYNCPGITDASLPVFLNLRSLQNLDLRETSVSWSEAVKILDVHPNISLRIPNPEWMLK